jgi:hypothetical protein
MTTHILSFTFYILDFIFCTFIFLIPTVLYSANYPPGIIIRNFKSSEKPTPGSNADFFCNQTKLLMRKLILLSCAIAFME